MNPESDSHALPAEPRDGPSTVQYRPVAPQMRSARYAMKRFHARGGMGEVWLATDEEIGRDVALKLLRPGREANKDRFFIEAQITGQLEHPGIVPVHDLGVDDVGQPFYVMKFVHGRTLKEVLDDFHAPGQERRTDCQSVPPLAGRAPRELEWLRLLEVFVALCRTVAYAHSRGVLHRDLKPTNVMLGSFGETLVLDWGLAKVMGHPESSSSESSAYVHLNYSGESSETEAGAVLGAAPYMAPEVAEGKAAEADERTDVYLLGATLYEILTGRPPRQGSSKAEMIELARTVSPVPPRKLNRRVAKPLEAICLKALARRKQDRYATSLALAEDVQRFLAGEPVSACQESLARRAARWARRHQQGLARAAVVVLLLGLAAFGFAQMRELGRMRDRQLAREDLKEFRRLADEVRVVGAESNAFADQMPYRGPGRAQAAGKEVLALADKWEPRLEQVLPDEWKIFKSELYDLLLVLAQVRARQSSDAAAGQEMLDLLERARRLADSSRSYHRLRAQAQERLGDRKQADEEQRLAEEPRTRTTALDHFLRAEEQQAKAMRGAMARGDRSLDAGEQALLQEAVAEYRQALEVDPHHYWSYFRLGQCRMVLRQAPEALEALSMFISARPDSPWGRTYRGLARALQQQYDAAEQDLKEVLDQDRYFGPARLNLGIVYLAQKKVDQALKEFETILRQRPGAGHAEAAFYRGQVFLRSQQWGLALEDFDSVLKEQPDFAPAHHFRARVHLIQGRNGEALRDLDAFLGQNRTPEQRAHLLRLVIAKLPPVQQKQKWPLALEELTKAEKAGARSATLYNDLGAVLALLGKPEQAIEVLTRGLELAPQDIKLRNNRGGRCMDLKPPKYDEALKDFAVVAGIQPRTSAERLARAEAHTMLGYIHACKANRAEAQRQAMQALAVLRGENHFVIQHNLACIYAMVSKANHDSRVEDEDLTVAFLNRGLELAGREGARAEALQLIRNDASVFAPSIPKRVDFKELVQE